MMLFALLLLVVVVPAALGFASKPLFSSRFALRSSWQDDVDSALNIDTSCDTRREKVLGLVQNQTKRDEVLRDVQSALREVDEEKRIEKLTTGETRRALKGAVAFRKQILRELPDFLTKQVPALLSQGPGRLLPQSPPGDSTMSLPKLAERLRDITQDPILLQSTKSDLQREVKNIFKGTPEGLETPAFEVLQKGKGYEVRRMSGFSVCSVPANSSASAGGEGASAFGDAAASGRSFNALAGYLFGGNEKQESMAMTTPVIMTSDSMSFVLPRGKTAATAPAPASASASASASTSSDAAVTLSDVAPAVLAVREFTGIATASEVALQRAILEDALIFDGLGFDNLSLQVFQFSPPYTLPWVRRNEVALTLTDSKFLDSGAGAGAAGAGAGSGAGAGDGAGAVGDEPYGDGTEAGD